MKLGKLVKAQKVFRGVSGRVLPNEFWIPNEFNVCGGVEVHYLLPTYSLPTPYLLPTYFRRIGPLDDHASSRG